MRKLFITVFAVFIGTTTLIFGFAAGIYVEPKLSFMSRTDTYPTKLDSMALGGGLAFGYDFFRATRFLPLRVDLEYIGRGQLQPRNSTFHTLLVNVYYDVNIFSIAKTIINDTTLSALYEKEPFMALFLVLSFGGKYNSNLVDRPAGVEVPQGLTLYQYKQTSSSFIFGVGAGGIINFNRIIGLTLTYRFFVGPHIKQGHEALLGLRFTVPRSTK